MFTAVTTHLVSKTRRSDSVSALLSHRSRLPPFSSHMSSCLPTSTLMSAPRPTSVGCSASVHPPGLCHTSELHSFFMYALNSPWSVHASCPTSAAIPPRAPPPPLHQALPKATLSPRHAEIAVDPRVFLENNVHSRVIRLLLHLRDPLPGAPKNDRALHDPLGAHVSDWPFTKGKDTWSELNRSFS